ncbi:hypothetical protein [Bacillus sp. FSL K6-3431]|uniref:hypothetical protein n=1 Tax=Bacillus sp. FSL K6-3431 TaxID=2921500 RepID=UPI0030F572C0
MKNSKYKRVESQFLLVNTKEKHMGVIGEPATNGSYEGYYSYESQTKAEVLYKDNENYLVKDPTIGLDSNTYLLKLESLKMMPRINIFLVYWIKPALMQQ